MNIVKISISIIIVLLGVKSYSQSSIIGQETGDEYRVITTAVPFLSIAPDSRAGAMGDAGVATSPDINSIKYNAAKYAFIEDDFGVSISYVPWLRKLVNDINLAYLSGYKKIGDKQVISGSLLYFSLGDITFTDEFGSTIMNYTPNEFQFNFAYTRLLSEKLAMSMSLGYVYSNLSGSIGNQYTTAGKSVTADIGLFYKTQLEVSGKETDLNLGMSITNIGNKMSYSSNNDEKSFLPMMIKMGASWEINMDDYNSIMITGEFGKLLVPSPPIYYGVGDVLPDGDTVRVSGKYIEAGKDPNISVGTSLLQSWYDAPGVLQSDGTRKVFKEEIREFTWSAGAEYWYAKQFALRAGYFHESQMKGNRKFYTLGLGLRLNSFGIDFSYLIAKQNNPLENTLRFSLLFNFGGEN